MEERGEKMKKANLFRPVFKSWSEFSRKICAGQDFFSSVPGLSWAALMLMKRQMWGESGGKERKEETLKSSTPPQELGMPSFLFLFSYLHLLLYRFHSLFCEDGKINFVLSVSSYLYPLYLFPFLFLLKSDCSTFLFFFILFFCP